MRATQLGVKLALSLLALAALSGCATATKQPKLAKGNFPSKYKTDYGGNLYIGRDYAENGGLTFYPAHLDVCWIANGFDFNGYDVLYIEPTGSTVTIQTNQTAAYRELIEDVPQQLRIWLAKENLFHRVVTDPADIPPGARVLTLQATLVKFGGGRIHKPLNGAVTVVLVVVVVAAVMVAIVASHGGGGGFGLGGGFGWGSSSLPYSRPRYRIYGRMMDGDKPKFEFQAYRAGGFSGGLHSMMLDLTDFVAAVAGKYKLR